MKIIINSTLQNVTGGKGVFFGTWKFYLMIIPIKHPVSSFKPSVLPLKRPWPKSILLLHLETKKIKKILQIMHNRESFPPAKGCPHPSILQEPLKCNKKNTRSKKCHLEKLNPSVLLTPVNRFPISARRRDMTSGCHCCQWTYG